MVLLNDIYDFWYTKLKYGVKNVLPTGCLCSILIAELFQMIGFFTSAWGCGDAIPDNTEYTCTVGALFYTCSGDTLWSCEHQVLSQPVLGLAATVMTIGFVLTIATLCMCHRILRKAKRIKYTAGWISILTAYSFNHILVIAIFGYMYDRFYAVGWSACLFVISGATNVFAMLAILGCILLSFIVGGAIECLGCLKACFCC